MEKTLLEKIDCCTLLIKSCVKSSYFESTISDCSVASNLYTLWNNLKIIIMHLWKVKVVKSKVKFDSCIKSLGVWSFKCLHQASFILIKFLQSFDTIEKWWIRLQFSLLSLELILWNKEERISNKKVNYVFNIVLGPQELSTGN